MMFNYKKYNYDLEHPLEGFLSENMLTDNISGNFLLNNDISPKSPLLFNGTKVNITLNNKTIKAPVFVESNGQIVDGNTDSYALWVKDNADLVIDGNGTVISQSAKYSMAVWAQGGTVTIKGGKYFNNGEGSDLIYASAGGKVYIYGGEFHPCKIQEGVSGTKQEYCALNIKDSDRETSEIIVYGGKFYNFNPANNKSEGNSTNFVADGYVSIEVEDNVWEVLPEQQ